MSKKLKIFLWTLSCFCVLMAGLIVTSIVVLRQQKANTRVEVSLLGEEEITLEVGSTYTDAGAQAKTYNIKKPEEATKLEVTVSGKVNTEKIGDYELTYSTRFEDFKAETHRVVHIVDTQQPVITLTTNPDSYTLPGQPYQEEGFTATDNYDGDLTKSVQSEEKDGVVYYTVTDSSGNTAAVQRTVVYNDPEAPQLTLLGDARVTIQTGKDYIDAGCTAVDNVKGDMTSQIVVSGYVDSFTPGTYTLTYSATDDFENTGTVTRTVVVLPFDPAQCAPTNGKVIYLTFDDGPGPHTEYLLDILAKYSVKATFFVVNNGYYSTLTRAAAEGHTVAIHTASHRFNQVYASDEAYFADLEKMQAIIETYTGIKSMLLRFPGGSSNTLSAQYNRGIMTRLTQAVVAAGYRYFDWNVDSRDAGGATSSDEVFYNVINGVSRCQNSVVLQHDIHGYSVRAVEKIIIWGLMNGYTFQPITADSPGAHHGVYN